MNRIWKSIIILLWVLAGTALLRISHAQKGDALSGVSAWNNDYPRKIVTGREPGMGGLPINGKHRKKGLLLVSRWFMAMSPNSGK
jgi:hypothetical protein